MIRLELWKHGSETTAMLHVTSKYMVNHGKYMVNNGKYIVNANKYYTVNNKSHRFLPCIYHVFTIFTSDTGSKFKGGI